jgi:Cdc6-like AAA superfamily ATPase
LGDKREIRSWAVAALHGAGRSASPALRAACAIEETHGSSIHTPDLVET